MESRNGKAKAKPPRFKYIDSERLPKEVHDVMKDIQKSMMDDIVLERDGSQRKTVPNMPKDFICSEATSLEKEEMMKLAGKGHEKCSSYRITIPFFMQPYFTSESPNIKRWFVWSGSVISFSKVSDDESELAIVKVEGSLLTVRDPSTGERNPTFFPISGDHMKELRSKPLIKFLESPLVVSHPDHGRLVSSYKMTISWLRSRLDKALNKYKRMKKEVEVIPTIKQKEGGPLLLHVNVEIKKDNTDNWIKHEFLFIICPAFRVSRCRLAIPVVSDFGDLPTDFDGKDNVAKQFLWKIITKCSDTDEKHDHKKPNITTSFSIRQLSEIQIKENPDKPATNDKSLYKESITQPRPIASDLQKKCEECRHPASRVLLEYYYQYGYIPEEEANRANSFVTDILNFLKDSIREDRKDNDPRIIDFVKSGSVAEKLKVIQPDEFDVMIQIDLPKSTECYTFKSHDAFPTGYAICQVKRSHTFSRGIQRCFRKSDEFGHCLAPDKFAFGWLYGKMQLAINKYKKAFSDGANLKLRPSGPALLLEITPPSGGSKLPRVISVDLVLALKLSETDSRYAVAKRAKEEQFYQKIITNQQSSASGTDNHGEIGEPVQIQNSSEAPGESENEVAVSNTVGEETTEKIEYGRKNLMFLWRISYSAQEKRYLEYVKEKQQENGVEGCQDICLMILKTICTREILKREDESVLYREVSSYILKTALFHVLAMSDLVRDWTIDCLADRYVDLLNKLSKWKMLPHFFFNNASVLQEVFPEDSWCEGMESKNLLDELHPSLRLQLLERFSQIVRSFTSFKEKIDEKYARSENDGETSSGCLDYETIMKDVLDDKSPEEVIHPPFTKARSRDPSRKSLIDKQAEGSQVRRAAVAERKSGHNSDVVRNLQRPREDAAQAFVRQRNNPSRLYYTFDSFLDNFLL